MAAQKGKESNLVETWGQVEANIHTLEAARTSPDDGLRREYGKLILKGTCFVAYQFDSGQIAFAPSKFIGYVGNDFSTHVSLRGRGRDGGDTNKALEKIVGAAPESDDSAEEAYRRYCKTLGLNPKETGAFGNPRKYWLTDKVIQSSAMQEISLPDWTPPPETSSTITRKVRDTSTTKRLKRLYDYKCMVCSTRLGCTGGPAYAEGAHVRPIGRPHEGPDKPENIVVLCPNHHVMLDAGLLGIDPDTFKVRLAPGAEPVEHNGRRLQLRGGHTLRREHLEYHMREIFDRQ